MGSPHHTAHSHSMPRPYKCNVCGMTYAMEWARNNHQRKCAEKLKAQNQGKVK